MALLIKYIKTRILKKKAVIAGISSILNGVIVHSVNSGGGFYIGNLNKDKKQDD